VKIGLVDPAIALLKNHFKSKKKLTQARHIACRAYKKYIIPEYGVNPFWHFPLLNHCILFKKS